MATKGAAEAAASILRTQILVLEVPSPKRRRSFSRFGIQRSEVKSSLSV